jgi:hypothetical protein
VPLPKHRESQSRGWALELFGGYGREAVAVAVAVAMPVTVEVLVMVAARLVVPNRG